MPGNAPHSRVAELHPPPVPCSRLLEKQSVTMLCTEVATKNIAHGLPGRLHEVGKCERGTVRHNLVGNRCYFPCLVPGWQGFRERMEWRGIIGANLNSNSPGSQATANSATSCRPNGNVRPVKSMASFSAMRNRVHPMIRITQFAALFIFATGRCPSHAKQYEGPRETPSADH